MNNKTYLNTQALLHQIHVWAPGLEVQRKFNPDFPVVALRVPSVNSDAFYLVEGATCLGQSSLGPGEPLSGTNGRAVCVLNTFGGVRVWWDEDQFACGPTVPYNAVTDTAESIIRKVLRRRTLPKELRK